MIPYQHAPMSLDLALAPLKIPAAAFYTVATALNVAGGEFNVVLSEY